MRSPKVTAFSNFQQIILGKNKENTLQKAHLTGKNKVSFQGKKIKKLIFNNIFQQELSKNT